MIDYFASSVRRILGHYLREAGFDELAESRTRMTFSRESVVVSFAYQPEDLPQPWVAVDIGLAEPNGLRLFGIWRVVPAGAADYPMWRFFDLTTLESVLARDLEELLKPYASDLWSDRERIERVLAIQASEVEDRYLADQRDADLQRARRAFADGRFQDVIDAYCQVAPDALSASDRRLLYISRQKT